MAPTRARWNDCRVPGWVVSSCAAQCPHVQRSVQLGEHEGPASQSSRCNEARDMAWADTARQRTDNARGAHCGLMATARHTTSPRARACEPPVGHSHGRKGTRAPDTVAGSSIIQYCRQQPPPAACEPSSHEHPQRQRAQRAHRFLSLLQPRLELAYSTAQIYITNLPSFLRPP